VLLDRGKISYTRLWLIFPRSRPLAGNHGRVHNERD
jgi:hypothetical protein